MLMEELEIDDGEQDASLVNLFSPFYSYQHRDCLLCIYKYIPKFSDAIEMFQKRLEEVSSKLGSGIETCVNLVLRDVQQDESMKLLLELDERDIVKHFDAVFGNPMCGYNRLKTYNFFSLLTESTINNPAHVRFMYDTYKHSRNTSLCPYSLLAVYVFTIMSNTIGEVSEYKKKHDFLWMYNCLSHHNIRSGRT